MVTFSKVPVETADRIRLSVLEPPCRCREPLLDEGAKRRTEIELDMRNVDFQAQLGPVLQAVDALGDDERLRVRAKSMSWPLMAALQSAGERYQIVRREVGDVEFLVWRFYSEDERERYLRQWVG